MKFKSKGFTLIELLVVVAIISLLSSVVLASLKEARDKAKATAFREYSSQLVIAAELYRSETNSIPSTVDDLSNYIAKQNFPDIFLEGFGISIYLPQDDYYCGYDGTTEWDKDYFIYFNLTDKYFENYLNNMADVLDCTYNNCAPIDNSSGFNYKCVSTRHR